MPDVPARRPVEPMDTMMFRGEDDPRTRSTLVGVFVLEQAPAWEQLLDAFERITRLIVPLRQRIVEPPMPVTAPVWAVDPDFDLRYHIRRTRVPAPGTEKELLELLEPLAIAPLDRARPLWEFTLVEGLADGRAAWITKVNHAIADGIGGQELGRLAFDLEPEAARRDMPEAPAGDLVSPNDLVRRALAAAPATAAITALRGAQTAARVADGIVRRPQRTMAATAEYARSLARIMRGPDVSPSPLLRGRSLRRRLLVMEVALDDLKEASKAAGGSINDGFLAAVCGGLRRYHEELGAPVASLPIAIPINLRTGDDPAGGNRWTGARLAPPVDEPDPATRIRRIRQQVLEARQEPALDAFSHLAPIAVLLPSWLLSSAAGGAVPDLQVSNVPGSPVPLYLVGAKVLKVFPFGPLPGPAAMITVHSYVRTCYVGINLDPAAITEPDRFLRGLHEGVDEVLALRPRPKARKRSASA